MLAPTVSMHHQGVANVKGNADLRRIEVLHYLVKLGKVPAHVAPPGRRMILHNSADAGLFVQRSQVFELRLDLAHLLASGRAGLPFNEAQAVELRALRL